MQIIAALFFLTVLGLAYGVIHKMVVDHIGQIYAALMGYAAPNLMSSESRSISAGNLGRLPPVNDNFILPLAA